MCEESSNSEESVHFPCREGYVCDFGTTPDPDLEAPEGQFTQLCPVGFVCTDATGLGQAYRQVTYHGDILVGTALCPSYSRLPIGLALLQYVVAKPLSAVEDLLHDHLVWLPTPSVVGGGLQT